MRRRSSNLDARPNPCREWGFSLLELLMVITIMLILAAIAIPRLIGAKEVSDEAATVSNMHAISNAEMAYITAYPNQGFSPTLAALGGTGDLSTVTAANLLDQTLAQAAPTKSGYSFSYTAGGGAPTMSFTLNADPLEVGITGVRHFFTDQSGVIRANVGAPATISSPTM